VDRSPAVRESLVEIVFSFPPHHVVCVPEISCCYDDKNLGDLPIAGGDKTDITKHSLRRPLLRANRLDLCRGILCFVGQEGSATAMEQTSLINRTQKVIWR
jgi:hypothetical protein